MKYFLLLTLASCASQKLEPLSPSMAARRGCVTLLQSESIGSAYDFVQLGHAQRVLAEKAQDPEEKRRIYRCALAAFEAGSVLSLADPEPVFESAVTSLDLRDFSTAARGFHRVLEIEPAYPLANLRLAQIARNGGDLPAARAYLSEEKRVSPEGPEAWLEQGDMEITARNFLRAATQFTRALKLAPGNREALLGRAIALDPTYADAYWQLGLLHQEQKKDAIADFQAYRRLVDPASPMAVRAEEKLRELRAP
jgi:tetratricopeptide (TPR) repeat protein